METCKSCACHYFKDAKKGISFLLILDGSNEPLSLGQTERPTELSFVCFKDNCCVTFSYLTAEREVQLVILNCEEIAVVIPLD
ncbi:hypothetical protein FIU87_07355 [Bacillus sp. THAF10]|uniref:hypothetical protein n=1 Tax=Bacillus sp. THAF10 TaxID=2587848 RepID=UPI0012688FE5|nr:hypothetical protein [Bacillus sp. THAF10]QFT88455.1 hypothetical protein FIU87_07355 [Bacillus sp. THAF10]